MFQSSRSEEVIYILRLVLYPNSLGVAKSSQFQVSYVLAEYPENEYFLLDIHPF